MWTKYLDSKVCFSQLDSQLAANSVLSCPQPDTCPVVSYIERPNESNGRGLFNLPLLKLSSAVGGNSSSGGIRVDWLELKSLSPNEFISMKI